MVSADRLSSQSQYSKSKLFVLFLLSALLLAINNASKITASISDQRYAAVKVMGFNDPHTHVMYRVVSYNVTQMAAESTTRSRIIVTKVRLDDLGRSLGQPESIQSIKFHPTLVDFDLNCQYDYCYLIVVTSRSKRNVLLYSWQRTQFDLMAVRDSFARPHGVKLFKINSGFYVAIAQDQLHLSSNRFRLMAMAGGNNGEGDDEEPSRFMGCAVLKFRHKNESNMKYHQFIRLPFDPKFVNSFYSVSSNNFTELNGVHPTTNYHLVFSVEPNWTDQEASRTFSFIWSPLNDYFWPYRMPRSVDVIQKRPGQQLVKLPSPDQFAINNVNQTGNPKNYQHDFLGAVEACFHELQRVLDDRDLRARRLLDSRNSIWRSPTRLDNSRLAYNQPLTPSLANISAPVIVHGSVTVKGSLIESPQISLMGNNFKHETQFNQQADAPIPSRIEQVSYHSPAVVGNKFKQALFKLNYIREKLSRAYLPMSSNFNIFNNQIRFFGPIEADELILGGVMNSNVRLNGIPFRQLESELVSLAGSQHIGGRFVFEGSVTADMLEIEAVINDYYQLKDTIDITSEKIQVIETVGHDYALRGKNHLIFEFVEARNVILAHNASINSVQLADFITRDNRTQFITGRKMFKRLSMARLDLANQGVLLNNLNISHIARNAILLRTDQSYNMLPSSQTLLAGQRHTFRNKIRVDKLTVNSIINQHINLTSLIQDSIKTNNPDVQQIFGQKNFLNPIKISSLSTEGSLNGVEVGQMFNLNPSPPSEHYSDVPISGQFKFTSQVDIRGSMNANLVNGIDLTQRAVRRLPAPQMNSFASPLSNGTSFQPQIVRGYKIFFKPLRVLNNVRLADPNYLALKLGNTTRLPYPLVNNINLKKLASGLAHLNQNPSTIFVENLELDGNLNIPNQPYTNGTPRAILGNYTFCPLDVIRSRAVLSGPEDQTIEAPISVQMLRAESVLVGPGALNQVNFPEDFVLRTRVQNPDVPTAKPSIEYVYGRKHINHLILSPSFVSKPVDFSRNQHSYPNQEQLHSSNNQQEVRFDQGARINQLPYSELKAFISQEQMLNSTGEKVFNSINVHGRLFAKHINGNSWPTDILLRSLSSRPMLSDHRRIYSKIIFSNSSNLFVENQLVLRGPIQLNGLMNGINLTEFSRRAATYGDKDLYSVGRPIRNKIFMGGLTVRGEIRSQGLINGVNFEEMRKRVVTVAQNERQTLITSPKIFMSDIVFQSPVNIVYLNELPVDNYLKYIQFEPDGTTLKVHRKKTITGALRINANLFVRGLINKIDFVELQTRAISLAPTDKELVFNKTLIHEGDVYMDNLWIDERNGTIDGVRLTNLLSIGNSNNKDIYIRSPTVKYFFNQQGQLMNLEGFLVDCKVACNLQLVTKEPTYYSNYLINNTAHFIQDPSAISSHSQPPSYQPQPASPVTVPTRHIARSISPTIGSQARNLSLTTPPYSLASSYQPPIEDLVTKPPTPNLYKYGQIQQLSQRRPMSVKYERNTSPTKRSVEADERAPSISHQLDTLRKQIISINLIRMQHESDLVVGFIDASTNDVASYSQPDEEISRFGSTIMIDQKSYLQLAQYDFPLMHTTFHFIAGVATNQRGKNITNIMVSFGIGGSDPDVISVLPIEFPNGAMFVDDRKSALFLLISQDYSISTDLCPASEMILSDGNLNIYGNPSTNYKMNRAERGVHAYLFHTLKNSSSLTSSYFDLHQTIDLAGIDSFEKFYYKNSLYILAISRSSNRIDILLLRGYTGFQTVSHIDVPMFESVSILYSQDFKPILDIRQTNGLHRIMEAVVI